MKKIALVICFILSAMVVSAQDPAACSCPPMKMYVYDTKVSFKLDSPYAADEAGKYVEAQNSGDWLEGDYSKQQSDEFKVYKNLAPGASSGSTVEFPPDNGTGPSGVDFTSFVNLRREGNPGSYTYNVNLIIVDVKRGETIVNITQVAIDLGEVDNMIDALIGSLGSVPEKLRDHQKKERDDSNNTKWIGVKWKTVPDKLHLKIEQTTKVTIKAFDCADEKPVPDQDIQVKLTNEDAGSLNMSHVKTNASGEATVIFTAKNIGETRVIADFTYTDINDVSGNATSCSDQQNIEVADALYKITADFEATGPQGINYRYKGESMAYLLALADGTWMLAPLDKSREMDITIENAAMTDHMTFIGPGKYRIPFLFTVDKMDRKNPSPAPARMALTTVCPSKGKVQWVLQGGGQVVNYTCDIDHGSITYSPGATQVIPGAAGNAFAMNGVTNLDILQYFGPSQAQSTSTINQANANDLKQFAQRMQAHRGDPAFFNTAQGKADLKRMQAFQKQMGVSSYSPGGVGVPSASGSSRGTTTAKMLPGMARVRVQDMFDPKNTEAFNGSVEGSVGPIHASIKVKVERQE